MKLWVQSDGYLRRIRIRDSVKKIGMRLLHCFILASCMSGGLLAQAPAPPSSTLKVGDTAPDFTLPSTEGGKVHLADYIGKSTVVVAFFPAAFTGG